MTTMTVIFETLLFLNYMYILRILSKYLSTFCWNPPNGSYVKALPKSYTHADKILTILKVEQDSH